jgi:hypothetical protein
MVRRDAEIESMNMPFRGQRNARDKHDDDPTIRSDSIIRA